jgi:hypothetical protein
MEDGIADGKIYAKFEKLQEFSNIQKSLLAIDLTAMPTPEDERHESSLLRKLLDIVRLPKLYFFRHNALNFALTKLGEYQEQSYLLDPFLESLVTPVAECFKSHVKSSIMDDRRRGCLNRVERITLLLHGYMNARGYKTISPFRMIVELAFVLK